MKLLLNCLLGFLIFFRCLSPIAALEPASVQHQVMPGDTWTALAWRYNLPVEDLITVYGSINPEKQPVIGSILNLNVQGEHQGKLIRPNAGGLLSLSAKYGLSPWTIFSQNRRLNHPYAPIFYQDIFIDGINAPPKELPPHFDELHLSSIPAMPGNGLALWAKSDDQRDVAISLNDESWAVFTHAPGLVATTGTDALWQDKDVDLNILSEGEPLWTQPWLFQDGDWTYEKLTFTGSAIFDPDTMKQERERLKALWAKQTPFPLWSTSFSLPISDYVEQTSKFGARRSVNDGPYSSYHEGADFSAYRGSHVTVPAGGKIVLAEELQVRGNAVIIDHGLGIFSGYYHLHEISAQKGEIVQRGDLIGEVGSTGRSTGNHLHWDLLINGVWVDPVAWSSGEVPHLIGTIWENNDETREALLQLMITSKSLYSESNQQNMKKRLDFLISLE